MRIVKVGDPDADVLRRKAAAVAKFDGELEALADAMTRTIGPAGGIGIAAPQVGYSLSIFVVDVRAVTSSSDTCRLDGVEVKIHGACPLVVVNPKVTKHSGAIISLEEGCLSVPNARGEVPRHDRIDVEFFDTRGNLHSGAFKGILSRCFQHEFDHTKGILFTDRAERM
jgi:peptide deformylase